MVKNSIPVLPLRDIVVFPNMVAPLFVGREHSVNALNNVMTGDKKIFLISQKNSKIDNPNKENLYTVVTISKVIQMLKAFYCVCASDLYNFGENLWFRFSTFCLNQFL